MKLNIKKRTEKPFQDQDGNTRNYYWYVAEKQDGTAIRFGSTKGDHEIGQDYDLVIELGQFSNGQNGFRELI